MTKALLICKEIRSLNCLVVYEWHIHLIFLLNLHSILQDEAIGVLYCIDGHLWPKSQPGSKSSSQKRPELSLLEKFYEWMHQKFPVTAINCFLSEDIYVHSKKFWFNWFLEKPCSSSGTTLWCCCACMVLWLV